MAVIRTTRRQLSAYTDREAWKIAHNEAQLCFDLEEKLGWGVRVFQGLLDLENRVQFRTSLIPGEEPAQVIEVMPIFYRAWLDASEFFLDEAQKLTRSGYAVAGMEEFQATIEEARCLVENLNFEDEIPPIEELISRARPENPRPDRYGD